MYPMHSVGMKASLWRKFFPLMSNNPAQNRPSPEALVSQINSLVQKSFSVNKTEGKVVHGSKNWFMDQLILGCTIDRAIDEGYKVHLADGPRSRLHINKKVWNAYTDVHLAKFRLSKDGSWLDDLVENSIVLMRHWQDYKDYKQKWSSHFKIVH